jgi:hypothetical protein
MASIEFTHRYVFSSDSKKYSDLGELYKEVCNLLPKIKNKGRISNNHDYLMTNKPLTLGDIKKLEAALGVSLKNFMELGRG